MTCYPLGVASHLAIACDCIRRGDLDGAQAALARATVLVRDERRAHPHPATHTRPEPLAAAPAPRP
ncbi:hypothetical protein [Anaeromyxobacter terrae]|uniref:hypothetical protein n=1 Tax=Anaeromyxobacter terrae TaxID=2925406 RepID=UPI001F5766BF|nr:hypothetical protein [Anaeromyxobacter sp. SG22]